MRMRLVAGLLLAASAALAADDGKILQKFDFEKGLDNWRPHGSQPKGAAEVAKIITIVPGEEGHGKALKLTDCWDDSNPYTMRFLNVPATGEDTCLAVRFRACAPEGAKFMIKGEMSVADPARPGKRKMAGAYSRAFTGTGKWTTYECQIEKIPEGEFNLGIGFIAYLYSRDFTLKGELLVDDVELSLQPISYADRLGLDRPAVPRQDFPYSPADGAVWQVNPGSFTFLSPRDWKPGKYTYTLEYSQDPTFASKDTVRLPGRIWHMYIPDQPLAAGKWYWRYGVERQGKSPIWSKVRAFTVPADAKKVPFPGIEAAIRRIPKGHPRIYFTPETAKVFRERGLHGDLAKMTKTRMDFQRKWFPVDIPKGEPPFLPKPGTVPRAKWGEAWRHVISITHGRLNRMENLALTYLLSGDKEFGQEAAKYVKYFYGLDPDGSTAISHNDEPGMWIMRRGILSYDWTHEFYTPEEHKTIRKNLKLRAQRIYEILIRQNFDCHPFGSHQANGYQAILLEASIFLAPDDPDPEIRKWLRYSLTTFRTSWPPFGTPDGGWSEGPAYWSWSIDRGLRMVTILKNALGVDMTELPFIKNTGYYVLCGWPGKCRLYSGCDSFSPDSQASALYMLAVTLKNPDFLQPANTLKIDPLSGAWATVLTSINPVGELGKPRLDKLPKARLFPDTGFVVMRKTMTGLEDDIGMLFQSCPNGNHSHRHNSQNNIQFEAYGDRMFFSGGHYDGYGSAHHTKWTWQSCAHNCISFDDGKGQPRGGMYAGKIVHFADHGDIVAATGDATAAYPDLKKVLRTVVHVRPDVYLVRDRIESAVPRTFEFNLHTDLENKFTEQPDGLTLFTPNAGCRVAVLDRAPWTFKAWDSFPVQPYDKKKFPDRRHFRFSSPEKTVSADLVTVFLPFRKGGENTVPKVTRDGDTVTLAWPDGTTKKVRFDGDDATLVK